MCKDINEIFLMSYFGLYATLKHKYIKDNKGFNLPLLSLMYLNDSLEAMPKNFAIRQINATNANNTDRSIFTATIPSDLAGKVNSLMSGVTGAWGTLGVINTWTSGNNIMIKTTLGSDVSVYTPSFIVIFVLKA